MRLGDARRNVLVVTDRFTKKRTSSRLVTALHEVAERWILPAGLVMTATLSKKSSVSSRPVKVPTFSDAPLCGTSTLLLQDVLARTTVDMKMIIMEEMRDGLIPLFQAEDVAVDGTVIEDVGASWNEDVRF